MGYANKLFESHIVDCYARNVLLIVWTYLSIPSEPRVTVKCPLLKDGCCQAKQAKGKKCDYL